MIGLLVSFVRQLFGSKRSLLLGPVLGPSFPLVLPPDMMEPVELTMRSHTFQKRFSSTLEG